MKRYFKVKIEGSEDITQTVCLNIEDGSPASRASVEAVSKYMKLELEEITKSEYNRLSK